jgi:hypothetical protein
MAPFHRDSRLNGNSTNSASTSIDHLLNFLIVHQAKPEQQAMWSVVFRLVSTLHTDIDCANPPSPLPPRLTEPAETTSIFGRRFPVEGQTGGKAGRYFAAARNLFTKAKSGNWGNSECFGLLVRTPI